MDMGASVTPDGVRFKVWAPAARQVDVELVPSGSSVPLDPEGDGVWSKCVRHAQAGTRYRYRLNGQGKFPDPYSRSQPEGVHGPSEVVDPNAFEWHDAPARQLVITLSGTLDFQTRTGEHFMLRPGDILLAEDTAGTGHSWKLVDENPWRRAYVILGPRIEVPFVANSPT